MADEPATPPAGGSEPDPAASTAPPAGAPPEKTFSQADVDRIVTDRLNRQKAQFGDYDELKAKAARLAELETANQTETEKLQTQAQEAARRADEADRARQDALERARRQQLQSAVVAEAHRQGARDGEDVFALIDTTKFAVGDDGEYSTTADGRIAGVEETVKGLLDGKTYLRGDRARGPVPAHFDVGAQGGSAAGLSMNDLIRQAGGARST